MSKVNRFLNIVGSGFGVVGIFFVAFRLYEYADQIDFSNFTTVSWIVVILLSFIYGLANFTLARAWWHLLLFCGITLHWKNTLRVYGLSQLAKYLPGNIFHLAGRQALGVAAGMDARPLAKSAICELTLIAVAGILFGILTVPLIFSSVSSFGSIVLFVIIAGLLVFFFRTYLAVGVSLGLTWQAVFLVISGLVFVGTLTVAGPSWAQMPDVSVLCGAYVLAWLTGLVTPGAPAGVGVREMVLLILLGNQVGQADLLLAVVLGRVVTVSGDLLFFLASSLIRNEKQLPQES